MVLRSALVCLLGLSHLSLGSEMDAVDRYWLNQAATKLRFGKALGFQDKPQHLLTQGKSEIIDRWMAEPAFIDTTLAFSLFYLGFFDSTHDDSSIKGEAIKFPQAMTAVRELMEGGNYLKIWDLHHPYYVRPIPRRPEEREKEIHENRLKVVEGFKATLELLVDAIEASEEHKYCDLYFDLGIDQLPRRLTVRTTSGGSGIYLKSDAWFGPLMHRCEFGSTKPISIAHIREVRQRSHEFLEYMLDIATSDYSWQTIHTYQDFRTLDAERFKLPPKVGLDGYNFWYVLQNSSTNFNRRRGAYMLKRYFCDDLTPINVEAPESHSKGRHADDPSCRSCHYKLDPMAGFFKNHGVVGIDYGQAKRIILDDGVAIERQEYGDNWRTGTGDQQVWNIGYVRSATDDSMTDRGESLADLFAIIRRAPEARRCLVQRMFEYFTDGRMVDQGYLDHLTERFNQRVGTNSSQAYRETVRDILLSNTFAEPNPEPGRCYDFAPGTGSQDRPPCEIAQILENHCGTCHDSIDGNGGLDLTRWMRRPNGAMGFPHRQDGKSVSTAETVKRMLERIQDADPDRRMPLGMHMPSQDRQRLYHWLLNLDGGPS